jgi:hypothetical protein
LTPARKPFDPLRLLAALEQRRVSYVVIGELAEVLQGSRGMADTIEIVPALRPDNIERLRRALRELGTPDAALDTLSDTRIVDGAETVSVETPAGELVITPVPEGTRGWDDLRRGANREPLGGGVRPSIAGIDDLVRMNEVATTPDRADRARTLRRMIDLNRDLGIDL